MKRGTPRHPKTSDLADRLSRAGVPIWLKHPCAVGILESLWHFTAEFAPQGDIGKYSNKRIAAGCGWEKNPDVFIQLMVDSGWIDVDEKVRYVVHDWSQHCDTAVQKRLQRAGVSFVEHTEKVTEHWQTTSTTMADNGSLPMPMPMPEPQPMPEPVPMPAPKPESRAPLRFGTWTMDPTYECFVELYRKSGALISDDDLSAAHFTWRTLDFEQKQQRCERLSAGLDAGEWSEPRFIPKPRKFLESVWMRPVPKIPQSSYERKKDETLRLFNERMASHART